MHDTQEGALASTGYLAPLIPYFLTHISPANLYKERADERTRTSDWLLTSDRSGVLHFDHGA